MMFPYIAAALLFLGTAKAQTFYPVLLGGGADGSAGRILLSGDPDTRKLIDGSHCIDKGGDIYDIHLYVHENGDLRLQDIDGTTTSPVEFTCQIMDYPALRTSANQAVVQELASPATCPGTTDVFTRDPTTGTHSMSFSNWDLSIITGDGNFLCGSYIEFEPSPTPLKIYFLVSCKRNFLTDHFFDLNIVYEIDVGNCFSLNLDVGPLSVITPPTHSLERRYTVDFGVYRTRSFTSVAALNADFITNKKIESDSADLLTITGGGGLVGTELGEAIYAEGCISYADSRHYFQDGTSVMGMKFKNCVFSTVDDVMDGRPSTVTVVDQFGCGNAALPAFEWKADDYVFAYGIGGPVSESPHLEAPNCFRSELIANVGFNFKTFTADTDRTMVLECDVDYCTSSDDGDCFGNVVNSGSSYPTCPGSKRRRRSSEPDIPVPDYLPRKMNATFKIRFEDTDKPKSEQINNFCGKKPTITIVTVLEAVAIVAVLVMSTLMAVRLKSFAANIHGDSNSWFQNKSFRT